MYVVAGMNNYRIGSIGNSIQFNSILL